MFCLWFNLLPKNLKFLLQFHPERVICPALDRER